MRIGFDGKRAANNLTGLGNYSRSLIAQLALFYPQNQYLIYTQKIKNHPQVEQLFKNKNVEVRLPDRPGWFWRSSGIKNQLQRNQVDLFHGLSHEIPLGIQKTGISSVVTIHDLIFLKFPKYFRFIDRMIYKIKSQYACKHADRIVAISECTKRDIISFFNIEPDKIRVVYQSCDDSFKTAPDPVFNESVREKFKLPPKYVLNVGTIEPRKNLLSLVRAMKLVDADSKLVVVGRQTAYKDLVSKEIESLNLSDRVIFLQDVPFSELPAIYQMASVFAYPSIYEGFGIPIIEALYCGVPVIAATGSCLEEAGGPSSLYVSPLDHKALASGINQILHHPDIAGKMKTEGSDYVKKFNTEIIAVDMIDVYKSILPAKTKELC
ncbi:glycosyltransferase family 4 protein [Pedobacter sp. GR22-6]|uniref:glycosyltransferase family 4 protein n=1 Tax=Pedobacter sp. GR22-6 TaxID=3127957 RepID=UPI00307F81C0